MLKFNFNVNSFPKEKKKGFSGEFEEEEEGEEDTTVNRE